MFARKVTPSAESLERLCREIKQKRVQVHESLDQLLADETPIVGSGRVYEVFSSFESDQPPAAVGLTP